MMIIDGIIYTTRKEAADMLGVSVQTMAVWGSIGRYKNLRFIKFKGVHVHYALPIVEEHLKMWNQPRYDEYIKHRRAELFG